jgi:quinol monooxygenase YgiN
MSEVLTIVAHVRAKPGMAQLMLAEQKRLVSSTKAAPGCLRYELHVHNDDPSAVTFVEEWESAQAWQEHMRSDHMDAFRAAAGHAIADFALYRMHRVA